MAGFYESYMCVEQSVVFAFFYKVLGIGEAFFECFGVCVVSCGGWEGKEVIFYNFRQFCPASSACACWSCWVRDFLVLWLRWVLELFKALSKFEIAEVGGFWW